MKTTVLIEIDSEECPGIYTIAHIILNHGLNNLIKKKEYKMEIVNNTESNKYGELGKKKS